jgi:hypothetical protein
MATLTELLLGDARPKVESDCAALIEAEVAGKRGATGFAIKAGFKAVRAFKRDIVPDAVQHLLPDFVEKLEPLYLEAAGTDIEVFVKGNGERIADALLSITDDRARTSRHKVLVKAYNRLRPMGKKQVVAATPRIGQMLKANGC